MDKETWFGKTGLVMHEGFLMRTGKGATTKKRKWCKLLFDAKNNTAWIIYLHIDDTELKDADNDTIHNEIRQRAMNSKSRSDIYPGFMRAEGIIPLSEMEKLILVSEDQFELHAPSKSGNSKVWCLKVDEDDVYDWYINIIACVPTLVHEAEKEKLPGKLFGKAPNQYAVSLIGDTKYFPRNCYVITHTWTQGGAGKIRTAMKVSGGDELFGVKELRTVAKSGAVHRGEGKNRAIDSTLQKTGKSSLQDIKEEMALMEKFKSKIKFRNMLRIGTKYYGVMPMMPCDLRALRGLAGLNKKGERQLVGRYIMREIAADLETCHAEGYVHNDLKFLNVLVSKDQVALADFGICQKIQLTRTGKGPVCGSPEFWPWEMFSAKNLTGGYDEKIDIFALALIWAELILPLSKHHHRGSRLWPSKKAVLQESKKYLIHPGWKSTQNWKRLEPTANLLSSLCEFDITDVEEGAAKKIWKKKLERRKLLAGFCFLYWTDKKMYENIVANMLNPDPQVRPSANEVYSEACSLLGGRANEAKKLLNSLIQKLDKTKQRGYEKMALKEGRDYFRKSHQKMKAHSSQKNLLRCRYCKAGFSYTPLWCKCGRPSYTADGPTFARVS